MKCRSDFERQQIAEEYDRDFAEECKEDCGNCGSTDISTCEICRKSPIGMIIEKPRGCGGSLPATPYFKQSNKIINKDKILPLWKAAILDYISPVVWVWKKLKRIK